MLFNGSGHNSPCLTPRAADSRRFAPLAADAAVRQSIVRHRFVADMSDLKSIFGPEAPDVLIVAGYALPEEALEATLVAIGKAKSEATGNEDIPIKWNLKDVERALQLHGLTALRPVLLANADPVRAAVLEALRVGGATLFASVLQAYSNRRQVLGKNRPDLIRFAFLNLLQRFSRFAMSGASSGGSVLLDWPEKNQSQPFTSVYLEAWRDTPGFQLPPMRSLGFEPAAHFGVTDVDPLLQAADLVVGSVRAFVKYAQKLCQESDFGVQQFRQSIPSFYQSPNGRLTGWGFVISPKDCTLATLVSNAGAQLRGGSA